jgi:hypothetical protein
MGRICKAKLDTWAKLNSTTRMLEARWVGEREWGAGIKKHAARSMGGGWLARVRDKQPQPQLTPITNTLEESK